MNLPSPLILIESRRSFNLLRQHRYPCRIFFGWRCLSLLHHAPIRIKVIRDDHPAGEKEQGLGDIQDLKRRPCSFEPDPLSASADPENLRYHAVSKERRDRFHGFNPALLWLTAWTIKMLQRIREVGRRANQGGWMILAYRDGFSVLAPVLLGKQFGLVKDHLISQDVISGPG